MALAAASSMRQSAAAVAIAAALALAGEASSPRTRRAAAIALLAALGAAMVALPFPESTHGWMGDYATYVRSRASFQQYVFPGHVRFSSHLGFLSLYWIDRLLGADEQSYRAAFRVLTTAAGLAAVAGLCVLGALEAWSARFLRFAALVALAPATLSYFGYREIATLSLSAVAYPLLARGLRGRPGEIQAAGALLGLGFAFHGLGVLGIAGGVLAILAAGAPFAQRAREVVTFAFAAAATSASWLVLYVAAFGLGVKPHHAGAGFLFRTPFDAYVAMDRLVQPLFSRLALRDASWALAVQGAPIAALAPLAWRADHGETARALAFAVPGILFTGAFFFVQGVAVEIDLVLAAFPGIFSIAWALALSRLGTGLGLAVLFAANAAFWAAFGRQELVNQMIK
jgi:hypothetical protein